MALGGALTHLHGERPRWAPGRGPLAPDSRFRVRPAAAGIKTRAARSRGRGEAGARAPGSCGPHGAPHSPRPGANPRSPWHPPRSPRSPAERRRGARATSKVGLPPTFRWAPYCFALSFTIIIKCLLLLVMNHATLTRVELKTESPSCGDNSYKLRVN